MPNDDTVKTSAGKQKPIQVLRARRGGVSKQLRARHKQQQAARRQVRAALGAGPKTVPEVAAETGLATAEVFWLLMGLKKYGAVVEGSERDGYYEYRLVSESTQE